MKLGLNKQREILTMIQEIAFREHLTVKDVLNAPELQQIMGHEKWDRSQKTVHLRQYLRRRRYPSITSVERDFEAQVQSLDLESGIALIPPGILKEPHSVSTSVLIILASCSIVFPASRKCLPAPF